MAESTLSVHFSKLKEAVGHYLGYGGPDDWASAQDAEIEQHVQSGLRQFYYPPAIEGIEAGYTWSFLTPKTTLTTTADQGTDICTDDFSRLLTDMHHDADVYASCPIKSISRQQMRTLKSGSEDTGLPLYVTVRENTSDGSTGQRKEFEWWPVPDAVYTITYQYEAYQGQLDDDYPYPLGGMKHSELLIASCLSVAELRSNDERGIHWEEFLRQLGAAIAQDRKSGAQYFGPMDGPESGPLPTSRELRHGDVTYDGNTW